MRQFFLLSRENIKRKYIEVGHVLSSISCSKAFLSPQVSSQGLTRDPSAKGRVLQPNSQFESHVFNSFQSLRLSRIKRVLEKVGQPTCQTARRAWDDSVTDVRTPAILSETPAGLAGGAKELERAYQAKLRAIDKVELSKAVRDQTLKEGQELGGNVLWAEARMGELLGETQKVGKKGYGSSGGTIPTLPPGITKRISHLAQQLAENQDLIRQVIQEAEKTEDLPTRWSVLEKIKERRVRKNE